MSQMSNLRFVYFAEINHNLYIEPVTPSTVVKYSTPMFTRLLRDLQCFANRVDNTFAERARFVESYKPIQAWWVLGAFYNNVVKNKWSEQDYYTFIITTDMLTYFRNFCNFYELVTVDQSKNPSMNLNVDTSFSRLNWFVLKFPENHLELWKNKINTMLKDVPVPDELKPFYGEILCVN